jgi:hypothetical protein
MSKKVKTYWDEIKNEHTYFTAGARGWEIKYMDINITRVASNEKPTMKLIFPFGYHDGVPYSEKVECRKDANRQFKQYKMLAQASRDHLEFKDLFSRINNERWEDILDTKLKGFELGNYIRSKYLTERESYALFWNM